MRGLRRFRAPLRFRVQVGTSPQQVSGVLTTSVVAYQPPSIEYITAPLLNTRGESAGSVFGALVFDSPFDRPQRALCVGLFKGISERAIRAVTMNFSPGAGEMIELCATHFAAKNPRSMAIANRSMDRGEKLAAQFGAEVMRLAELPDRLHEFDAVISSTASQLPVLGKGSLSGVELSRLSMDARQSQRAALRAQQWPSR